MTSPALSSSSTMGLDRSASSTRLAESYWASILLILPFTLFSKLLSFAYPLYQFVLSALFTKPYKPIPHGVKPFGRVAIIGAGITGISTAAAFVSHGFEVVVYEEDTKLGGVWSRVNSTSGLQLNSLMYRFHPSIRWTCSFPLRDEILTQIGNVATKYHLHSCIRFGTQVTRVARDPTSSTLPSQQGHARWTVNDGADGIFDAVVGSIGTCGEPKLVKFKGQKSFKGQIFHSSQLDHADLTNKRVIIIGSGASGVESAELAVSREAQSVKVLARKDKWMIPRNTAIDVLISLKPYGAQTRLSWIPEYLIKKLHYRDQSDLAPSSVSGKGLFEGTPIVNSTFLNEIRSGLIDYKRGDISEITPQGVKFTQRSRDSKPGDKEGNEEIELADVIVLATGYKQPSLEAFPADLFPTEGDRVYARPNLYLQVFATEDWSILLTNASYKNAIGSVGNFHIGIYARLLMIFLVDKETRPAPRDMKTWVDVISYIKISSFGDNKNIQALDFFTYAELLIFLTGFHLFRISRLKWLPFILCGWGMDPPTTGKGDAAKSVI